MIIKMKVEIFRLYKTAYVRKHIFLILGALYQLGVTTEKCGTGSFCVQAPEERKC
jgi:hypothetical protein